MLRLVDGIECSLPRVRLFSSMLTSIAARLDVCLHGLLIHQLTVARLTWHQKVAGVGSWQARQDPSMHPLLGFDFFCQSQRQRLGRVDLNTAPAGSRVETCHQCVTRLRLWQSMLITILQLEAGAELLPPLGINGSLMAC